MAGRRVHCGSPASRADDSGDESEGGAPLYGWSPVQRVSRAEEVVDSPPNNNNHNPIPFNASKVLDSTRGNRLAQPGSSEETENPKTPSDQPIETPKPVTPRRSYSKSTLRAAAASYTQPPPTVTVGVIPPTLTRSAYPNASGVPQRQASVPVLIAAAPPGAFPAHIQGGTSLPGSANHTLITAMQNLALNFADDSLHPAQKAHREQIYKLQARIWGLRQGVHRQPSIPSEFLISLDYDMQELVSNTAKMNQAIDTLAAELKKALTEQQRIRELETAIRGLHDEVQEWKQRHTECKNVVTSLAARSDEDMRTIQFLKEQLRQNEVARAILQEQVNNKRNLWLKIHEDPQERAAVLESLTRTPTPLSSQTFAVPLDPGYALSPIGQVSVRSGSSSSSSSNSSIHSASIHSGSDRSGGVRAHPGAAGNPHLGGFYLGGGGHHPPGFGQFQGIPQSKSGPAVFLSQSQPQHQRQMSTTGSVHYAGSAASSRQSSSNRRTPRVSIIEETGSPKERKRNTPGSLLRSESDNDESLRWAEEFQSLFALVVGFCTSYFYDLPQIEGDWKNVLKAEANGDLWEYICRICQTNQEQERGDHALRLLQDRQSRPHLLQRLILQHIIVFMFSYEGWKDFSEDVDEEMERLEQNLKTIDPAKTYERQVLVDRRAQLVGEMVEGDNAAAFKNFKLTHHQQHLRTLIAPFLPRRTGGGGGGSSKNRNNKSGGVANEAFYDLFTIASSAWDLSARLFRSRMTFQWAWAEVGTRFAADAHEPVDCSVDRLTLQHEHCRVRLGTTPAVTLRNDMGMTIATRNILKAGVLVMRY